MKKKNKKKEKKREPVSIAVQCKSKKIKNWIIAHDPKEKNKQTEMIIQVPGTKQTCTPFIQILTRPYSYRATYCNSIIV